MKLIEAVQMTKKYKLHWLTIDKNGCLYAFLYQPSPNKTIEEWHRGGDSDYNYDWDEIYQLTNHEYPVKDWTKCIVDVRTLTL